MLKVVFHYTIQTQEEVFLSSTNDLEENNKNILIASLDFALSVTKSSLKEKSIITYQSAINKLDSFVGNKIIDLQKFTSKNALEFRDYLNLELTNSPANCNGIACK